MAERQVPFQSMRDVRAEFRRLMSEKCRLVWLSENSASEIQFAYPLFQPLRRSIPL
jgi:hypothetical protein